MVGGEGRSGIDINGAINCAESVIVTDFTQRSLHDNTSCGYDIDAVGVCHPLIKKKAWALGENFPGTTKPMFFECLSGGDDEDSDSDDGDDDDDDDSDDGNDD